MKEFIVNCKICGDSYPTDAKWKNTCYKCWLKRDRPERYKENFELLDITCEICGNVFVDEPWKSHCIVCYISKMMEEKQDDLEEREQFK